MHLLVERQCVAPRQQDPTVVSATATAVHVAIDMAGFLIRVYSGWGVELAAISLAAFLLRYAVVPYANHLVASLSGLSGVVASDAVVASYCYTSGLDGATISRLPCFVAGPPGDAAAVATMECPVCLGSVEEGETVRALPVCRHAFHARCVDAWLRLRPTCPVCRATFR